MAAPRAICARGAAPTSSTRMDGQPVCLLVLLGLAEAGEPEGARIWGREKRPFLPCLRDGGMGGAEPPTYCLDPPGG